MDPRRRYNRWSLERAQRRALPRQLVEQVSSMIKDITIDRIEVEKISPTEYFLPKGLQYDSWNVRSRPHIGSPIVAVLQAGELLKVTGKTQGRPQWLRVVRVGSLNVNGWCIIRRNLLRPYVGHGSNLPLEQSQSTVNFGSLARRALPATVPSKRFPRTVSRAPKSVAEDQVTVALTELEHQRKALERLEKMSTNVRNAKKKAEHSSSMAHNTHKQRYDRLSAVYQASGGKQKMVAVAQRIEQLLALLELHGLSEDQVPENKTLDEKGIPSIVSGLKRQDSVPHIDFHNPSAQTCWLSTMFQALWHSRCFHTAFTALLRPLPPYPATTVTGALQRTWSAYEGSGKVAGRAGLVPPTHLVKMWGRGYGDPTDCFADLQRRAQKDGEASQLRVMDSLFAQAVVTCSIGMPPPSPKSIAKSIKDMGVDKSPLLVVSYQLPAHLSRASLHSIVESLQPAGEREDLATGHRLVAIICFIHAYHHYVCFCQRFSAPGRWLFFNDLQPLVKGVARGRHRETDWGGMTEKCSRLGFTPTLLLYENEDLYVEKMRDLINSTTPPEAEASAVRSMADRAPECKVQ